MQGGATQRGHRPGVTSHPRLGGSDDFLRQVGLCTPEEGEHESGAGEHVVLVVTTVSRHHLHHSERSQRLRRLKEQGVCCYKDN